MMDMWETKHLRKDEFGIEIRRTRPRGWLTMTSEPLRESDDHIQVEYYRHLLTLPKSRCLRVDGQLVVDRETVAEAKDDPSYERA
jgi:hypothetical protein